MIYIFPGVWNANANDWDAPCWATVAGELVAQGYDVLLQSDSAVPSYVPPAGYVADSDVEYAAVVAAIEAVDAAGGCL